MRDLIASLTILCLGFNALIIEVSAAPCSNGQHCPDCDSNGDCTTQCERGYFGKRCRKECNRRCRDHLCELTETGIEYCIGGCVPGFRGTRCNIPCHNPGTQCAVCEGRCDGGYCWLSSTSCVSGCVDSYYGLGCKNCSQTCRFCNRSTGMCNDCHDPYRGLNCQMSCENCVGPCVSGCDEGCKSGFYGQWCDKMCSENCRAGPIQDAVSVLECDQNTSTNCFPDCDSNTGDCIHGCNDGWYGRNCSSRCSRKCAYMSCTESGSCAAGCAPGYAGIDCSCTENCIHEVCYPNNGSCVNGCINGYYGALCNISCKVCLDGVCDRTHGTCIRGCNNTDGRCKSTCTHDCSIDVCLTNISCKADDQPKIHIRYVVIGLSSAMFFTGILCAFCILKCCCKRRNQEADTYIVEYQSPSNRYWEIRDADVGQVCGSPEDVFNDDIPPLADNFQEARCTHSDVSSGCASGYNPPYTPLMTDNYDHGQTTVITYISPSQEKDDQ
ncbi:multiple epidermal growth factor-like domains protein 10 [Haliotis asinina]|uniref:multiple epidermal growth factor-like domains protein 10 n=1 Tax=Haliotis asinina TaxID=109174 RepID=UPI00353220AE